MPKARGGALAISEAEWQEQVLQLAHYLGWQHLHVRRAIGKGKQWVTATNLKGWFDLLLWHPPKGGLIAAELKSEDGEWEADQQAVAASFQAAGFATYLWRPSDLDQVRQVLTNPPGRPYA